MLSDVTNHTRSCVPLMLRSGPQVKCTCRSTAGEASAAYSAYSHN